MDLDYGLDFEAAGGIYEMLPDVHTRPEGWTGWRCEGGKECCCIPIYEAMLALRDWWWGK